jgi:hypothetical protein
MNKTNQAILKKIKGTQFESDCAQMLRVNDGYMSRGIWNLLLSIRDCKLYSKGIKPHRNWRITDVKNYFGISGGASKCAEQLEQYKLALSPPK